jgi:PAS domain S-box-containing protein
MILNEEQSAGVATAKSSSEEAGSLKQSQGWPGEFLQSDRLASIINSAMDGILIIDEYRRIRHLNYAAESMFLCSADEALGQPVDRFIAELFRGEQREHMINFGEAKINQRAKGSLGEIRGMRANGEDFPLEASISQVESDGQNLYTLILRDITERKRLEEELRDLSGRLISAQDAERRCIARELHEELNERVAILSIELDQLYQNIPKELSGARALVKDMRVQSHEISSGISHLRDKLHCARLEHLGLVAALKGLCCDFSKHQDLKTEFRYGGFSPALPKDIELCIFQIARESLQNVIKHSGASAALVVLEKTDQSVRLSVSDEGCGFDEESARIKGGLGLIGMRERVRLVGGDIFIRSQPSRGTQIDVSVPLERKALMR